MVVFDVVVIGGGVVGLAVLRAATLHGWKCALVEAQPDLLSAASGSNSGIACTGVDATPGTLERALIRDANSQFRTYCRDHNLPTRPCGSLVCLWPKDEDRLDEVLAESLDAGDIATRWTPTQVAQEEPNLSQECQGAVHIPGEVVVDPWLYSISLGVHARENGAQIYTNFEVTSCSFQDGIWTIVRRDDAGVSDSPSTLQAKVVVNVAGIQADRVQSQVHDVVPWAAKPRRGQYRVYQANPNTMISHPIQPVPSQFTKGIFVFSTIYNQLVVGPTALDQTSRTDRDPDPAVAQQLQDILQRIVPGVAPTDYVGEYVGIRPGTNHRDYQIHLTPSPRPWLAVAGIRSTGLTASLGIGDYAKRLLCCVLPEPSTPPKTIQTTPLPPVEQLVKEYRQRGDGHIVIHGHMYRVTHPLTRFGWDATDPASLANL